MSVEARGCVRENVVTDLRIEDNEEPLAELERLLLVEKAYHHADLGDLAVEKGDIESAMAEYATADNDIIEYLNWKTG